MSTYKTPNLNLHKWESTDKILRQEFNDNFDALDAKIKEKEDEIGVLSKKSAYLVNVVEFEDLIPAKNTITDPTLWDWTAAVQASQDKVVSDELGGIEFPNGIFNINSVKFTRPMFISGVAAKHHFNKSSTGLTLSDLPKQATIIVQKSLTDPCFSLEASTIQSGIQIEGILFYQEHSNYSTPTAYPYAISDERSTSYWSGVTIKNCSFPNCYKGISLTHSERFDISDINGDFFFRGIFANVVKDVSKLERIHIWNFARSTSADAFRWTDSSSYAIRMIDVDELFMSEVFIWDRKYGIQLDKVWGTLRSVTTDAVAYGLDISNPKNFGLNLYDIKINSVAKDGYIETPIKIYGTDVTTTATMSMDNVHIWRGSNYTYGYESAIIVDYPDLNLTMDNIHLKNANRDGILIKNAKNIVMDNIIFSNFFGNQQLTINNTLATVGIRNESITTNITIGKVESKILTYIYDGYSEKLSLMSKPSIVSKHPIVFTSVGTITPSSTNTLKKTTYTNADLTNPSAGLKGVTYWADYFQTGKDYIYGLVYENTTNLISGKTNDTRFFSFPSPPTEEVLMPISDKQTAGKRLTLMRVKANNSGIPRRDNPSSTTLSGTIVIHEFFVCEGKELVRGSQPNVIRHTAKPSTANEIWNAGEWIDNPSPTELGTAGSKYIVSRFKCITGGSPGTWVDDRGLTGN